MSRYEESTLTPVASLGVSWMRFFCSAVYVSEHVCGFPMYCTVIFFFFFPVFVSFTVCKPFMGSALVRLEESGYHYCLVLVEGSPALNIACPFARPASHPGHLLRSWAAIQRPQLAPPR